MQDDLGLWCKCNSYLVDLGNFQMFKLVLEKAEEERSQDGRGIGQGDHFLPYKFIERTIECRANFTKQFLITS